jgi:hypothetical protein
MLTGSRVGQREVSARKEGTHLESGDLAALGLEIKRVSLRSRELD